MPAVKFSWKPSASGQCRPRPNAFFWPWLSAPGSAKPPSACSLRMWSRRTDPRFGHLACCQALLAMSSFYFQTQSRPQEKSCPGTCPSPPSPPPLPSPRDASAACVLSPRGDWQVQWVWTSVAKWGVATLSLPACRPPGLSLYRFLRLSFLRAIRRPPDRQAALQQPLLP